MTCGFFFYPVVKPDRFLKLVRFAIGCQGRCYFNEKTISPSFTFDVSDFSATMFSIINFSPCSLFLMIDSICSDSLLPVPVNAIRSPFRNIEKSNDLTI